MAIIFGKPFAIGGGIDTRDATAVAGDIRSGKTAYVNKQKIVGNAIGRGSGDISVSGNSVTIPKGIYDSTVQKSVGGIRLASTITPSNVNQYIPAGQYLDGQQTILGDGNLIPGNIKNGVSIFGVAGTASGMRTANVITFGSSGTMIMFVPQEDNGLSHVGPVKEFVWCCPSAFGTSNIGMLKKDNYGIVYAVCGLGYGLSPISYSDEEYIEMCNDYPGGPEYAHYRRLITVTFDGSNLCAEPAYACGYFEY